MIRSSHFILVLLSLAMTQRGLAAQHDLEPEIIVKEVILPVANADWETHWFGYQSVVDPFVSIYVGTRWPTLSELPPGLGQQCALGTS